jgi:hypothetical protein
MNLHIFSSLVIVTITTSLICLDYASTRAILMPRDDATSSSAYLLPYSTQLSREESDNNLTSIPIISSPTTISARLLSNISGLSDQQPVPLFSINKYFNSVKLKSILLIISPNSSIVVGEDIKSNNPNISTGIFHLFLFFVLIEKEKERKRIFIHVCFCFSHSQLPT